MSHSPRHGNAPPMAELAPASGSPLLPATTATTPKARHSIASAAPDLDGKIEYMDGFGVPRRSLTYTRRMILRGYELKMPDELVNENAVDPNDPEVERKRVEEQEEALEKEREAEAKRKANAEFKHECKTKRLEWIKDANKRIANTPIVGDAKGSKGGEKDATPTSTSPAKTIEMFMDESGNIRRVSLALAKAEDAVTAPEPVAEVRPADTVSLPTAVPTTSS